MRFDRSGDLASATMAFTFAALNYFFLPMSLLYAVFQKRIKSTSRKFKMRFGSIYEGLKLKRPAHRISTFLFVVRRLLLVLAAVFLRDYPGLQVIIYILLS